MSAAAIALTRPPLSVYLRGDDVHVVGTVLTHPPDNGGLAFGRLYRGAATLLLVPMAQQGIRASAVTRMGGEEVTGVCDLGPPSPSRLSERCTLRMGAASVTCVDTLLFADPGRWERRCSDGQTLTIDVPSGAVAIPMPFPLGR